MKLTVSNIAWTNEEEPEVAKLLKDLGVKYIEIAPTKKWEDPTIATEDQAKKYVDFWQSYGIEVVAFQSMLFNRLDLKIFESEKNRQETLAYLIDFIGLAGKMKAKRMVFGSPKNRQRGDMEIEETTDIAKKFFRTLGQAAEKEGVCFCIEPNPAAYACDFVTTAQEGIDFVQLVNNPGFGLHLDIAGMTLAGDNIAESIEDSVKLLKHFHISSPFLEQVEDREDVHHLEAAKALRSISYKGRVSIEMKPAEAGQNVARVEKAVRFAQSVYVS